MKNFGNPWHTKNLPPFELVEGETYLVPLKLLSKERRFDGGRGTEFYTFGLDQWRKITFSDQSLPKIVKEENNNFNEFTSQIIKRSTFC